jgi:23S rRNA pseudouridine2605 synthase
LTAEQLEAARAERMRQNGHGAITIEDVRTWIEETGLCIFLPRSAQAGFTAPTFIEAVAGQRTTEPTLELIASAESLLVRLEAEGVAVRLNLAGLPGDQPDYVVAGWVLPYIYALRGDRDWRRSPQLTGSRQVSQLAVQAAKQLDTANMTAPQIRDALGRETTESAVLRALHELWKQLRIIPVVPEVGSPALWQPLRQRFQKAIAEGASTSQVTAISVLASIYLQAVIAASMEDVELFLSPLTSRSKIREVVRGLAATRQVHSTTMGTSPMFYVAGTLPEFPAVPNFQISSSPSYRNSNYRGSAYLASYLDQPHEEEATDSVTEITLAAGFSDEFLDEKVQHPAAHSSLPSSIVPQKSTESAASLPRRKPAVRSTAASSAASGKSGPPRPRTGKTGSSAHPRERSRSAAGSSEARPSANGDRRRAPAPRGAASNGNGVRSAAAPSSGRNHNGSFSNGNGGNGHRASGSNGTHLSKPAGPAKNGAHAHNGASSGNASGNGFTNGAKSSNSARPGTRGSVRPDARAGSRPDNRVGSRPGVGAKSRPATGARSNGTSGSGSRNGSMNGSARPVSKSGPSNAKPASRPHSSGESAKREPAAASAAKRYSFSGQAKQAPKSTATKRISGPKAVSRPGAGAKPGAASGRTSRPAESKHRG